MRFTAATTWRCVSVIALPDRPWSATLCLAASEPLRYALSMLGLERQLAKRDDLLDTIGKRLPQIQS